MDPDADPGGPKTLGSYTPGSGSATLLVTVKKCVPRYCGWQATGQQTHQILYGDLVTSVVNLHVIT